MAQSTETGDGGMVMLGGPAHMTRVYLPWGSRSTIEWAADGVRDADLYRVERVAFGRVGFVEVLVHDSLTLDEALPYVHEWIVRTMGGTLFDAEVTR